MAPPDDAAILVLTTFPDPESAQAAVERLVAMRVVACGTVVPGVTSVYRWAGAIETATEAQVLLKSRRALQHEVERAITAVHPYEVPEILVLDVAGGAERYLTWIAEETAGPLEDAE
jgi:periplasmic divalent cation tolerance protein